MTYLKSWFSASKMTKCQIRLKNVFFHLIRLFWLYFRELSDLEQQKKSKKIFDFFGFFRIFSKCQNLTTGNFFFVKTGQNRLFSLYFRELSDLEQKKKKIFWFFFSFFWKYALIQHGKMPKISILRIFPDMRPFPEARGRLVLSFSTISEKSLDPIIFNSF